MLLRRGVNIIVILVFLTLLILNTNIIFNASENQYLFYMAVILAVPVFFLFREIRLWYFRERIILLHINHSVIIIMVILAGLSYYLYSLFDISSIPEFSAFYLISTLLFPVIGLISADQYVFIRKKNIVFNIDKRLRVRKDMLESMKIEYRQIIIKFSGKEKSLRLGRHEDKYPALINDIEAKLKEFEN